MSFEMTFNNNENLSCV